jgi:hypothetical protein
VETVWVPYFTATNVREETELPDDVLGAPIRLAKTKDGEVRFDANGMPRMRVAPELNAQVNLVRENLVSAMMARVGITIEERPDEYRARVAAQQLAGEAVMNQQAHDVTVAVEMLRLEAEAQAKAEPAAEQPAPETKPTAQNRRTRTPEHAETS